MTTEQTISSLRLVATQANMEIQFELLTYRLGPPDHSKLSALIDRAIDHCATAISRYPKEFDDQQEDQITVAFILQLNRMGLNAAHDATSGGHSDIVITDAGDFLWLAEAKRIASVDNSWIASGYDQLTGRYSTGLPAQDRGCLLIFCNHPRIDQILDLWLDYFQKHYPDADADAVDVDSITFWSRENSLRTGRPYHVRHKPVSVYFEPKHS